jgi:hypothetical protein
VCACARARQTGATLRQTQHARTHARAHTHTHARDVPPHVLALLLPPAADRRFQPVYVLEPSEQDTLCILQVGRGQGGVVCACHGACCVCVCVLSRVLTGWRLTCVPASTLC